MKREKKEWVEAGDRGEEKEYMKWKKGGGERRERESRAEQSRAGKSSRSLMLSYLSVPMPQFPYL